jgi:hypothetical protein
MGVSPVAACAAREAMPLFLRGFKEEQDPADFFGSPIAAQVQGNHPYRVGGLHSPVRRMRATWRR